MSDSIETARKGILENVKAFADAERGIEREQGKQTDAVAAMEAAGAKPDMLCDPTRKAIESYGIDRCIKLLPQPPHAPARSAALFGIDCLLAFGAVFLSQHIIPFAARL